MASFTQHPGRLVIGATVTLLILIWGTTWAAIRISLDGFPPFTGQAIRFAIAGLLLMALARAFRVGLGRTRRELGLLLIQTLLTFAISYGLVYWAEQWVPSGLTAVLFATFPLFVAPLAAIALPEERLGVTGVVGILIGFGGVAVIFSEDLAQLGGPRVATASLAVLLAPLSSAVAQVVIKRWGKGIHSFTLTAVPMVLAAMLMGGVAAVVEQERAIVLAPGPILATLYLAVAGSAVTFSLYFWLLHHVPATRLSLIAYGMPVVAVAVGTLALDEPITLPILGGSALVVVGVALAMRPGRPLTPRPPLPPNRDPGHGEVISGGRGGAQR